MNYRHIFHAGSFTDVFKHAVFALLLQRLCAKETPFCVIDTQAGIGRYDLTSDPAVRTGESRGGIARVLAAADRLPAELTPYVDAVRALNTPDDPLHWYPGSPRLARSLMRPQDRLVLAELHPDDVIDLQREFERDRNTSVLHQDGYRTLKAHVPPRERRGIVLIDPPFEVTDEFERLTVALAAAHARWATGIFAIWYPIKERATIWRFHDALERTGIRKILNAELLIHAEDNHLRLNGCGMIIVNPPWQLDQTLEAVLPSLHDALEARAGGTKVEWIVLE
jgi:23S rRNA (adenine2030-N6)-methyltransferase